MFGCSLTRQVASIKSWSASSSGGLLGRARSYAGADQLTQELTRSYSSSSPKRSLVQDLKYRFRIKAAQKYELYDASQGVSSLSRVTVEDVRNIWIHRLISEVELPSYKVDIPREIVVSMGKVIKEKIPMDQEGCIQFEDFLPHLVYLLRVEVTPDDEEEMVSELMKFYSDNIKDIKDAAIEDLRERAEKIIRDVREKVVTRE